MCWTLHFSEITKYLSRPCPKIFVWCFIKNSWAVPKKEPHCVRSRLRSSHVNPTFTCYCSEIRSYILIQKTHRLQLLRLLPSVLPYFSSTYDIWVRIGRIHFNVRFLNIAYWAFVRFTLIGVKIYPLTYNTICTVKKSNTQTLNKQFETELLL